MSSAKDLLQEVGVTLLPFQPDDVLIQQLQLLISLLQEHLEVLWCDVSS